MMANDWTERQDKVLSARQHVALLLDLLNHKGINLHYVLRHTGIFYDDLICQDVIISPAQLSRLISHISKLEQFPEISFLYGQQHLMNPVADLSHLLFHAPTVQNMIENLVDYCELFFPLLKLSAIYDQTGVYLVDDDPYGETGAYHLGVGDLYRRWLIESVFTAIITATNWRMEQRLNWSAKLDWSQPRWKAQYEIYWERVSFNSSMTLLHLPTEQLQLPIKNRSATLYQVAKNAIAQPPCGLLSFVRQQFRENQSDVPTLDQLSAMMGMSPANLKRRLKAHHSSYRSVLAQVNRQHALYLQEVKQLNDLQIAQHMQFFDVSNYRRALKRWGIV
ncbi:MAG: AraC family transcriptional regulator ligand-binding domain-containing protein [Vibrio sp.]